MNNINDDLYDKFEDIVHKDGRVSHIMIPKDHSKMYPVLFLIHGMKGIHEWNEEEHGNILHNMNNWYRNYNFVPMIVVMLMVPGKDSMNYEQRQFRIYGDNVRSNTPGNIADDIQYVRESFKKIMLSDKEHTAIAGLSLGGAGALFYAIRCGQRKVNSIEFKAIGAFSPSDFLWLPQKMDASWIKNKEELKLDKNSIHFMGVGIKEKTLLEGSFEDTVDRYENVFRENGTAFRIVKNTSNKHAYSSFNASLESFLKINIFKKLK